MKIFLWNQLSALGKTAKLLHPVSSHLFSLIVFFSTLLGLGIPQSFAQGERGAAYDKLGFYPGTFNIENPEGYNNLLDIEQWLGRKIPFIVQMSDCRNADSMMYSVLGTTPAWKATGEPVTLVMNVPLAFKGGNGSTPAGQALVRQGLIDTANGMHDAQYLRFAQSLKNDGFANAILRLGHEFDGYWTGWSCIGNYDVFISAWRHVHDIFKGVSPGFLFDYNGTVFSFHAPANAYAGDTRTRAEAAYPGDAYVDVVGLDLYDRNIGPPWYDYFKQGWNDPEKTWKDKFMPTLVHHRDFAVSKGKTVSFPEWAVQAHAGIYIYTGGDDSALIRNFYNWMSSLPPSGPGSLKYHSYFWLGPQPNASNPNLSYGTLMLTSPQLAESALMFSQLYGAKWVTGQIGDSSGTGSAPVLDDLMSGSFTLSSSGGGVTGAADDFQYACQSLTGDGQIIAQVTSIRNSDFSSSNPLAMAGVMIREDDSAGSRSALLGVAPGKVAFVTRLAPDSSSSIATSARSALPYWLKLVRNADEFKAYTSADGEDWTMVGSASIPMQGIVKIGLAVSSNHIGVLNTSTFRNVQVTRWDATDVFPYDADSPDYFSGIVKHYPDYGYTRGSIGVPSSEAVDQAGGTMTISASGSGIGGVADSFDFVHETLVGNGQIVARLLGVSQINASSKAGLMIREKPSEGFSAGSKSVLMSYAPGNGFVLTSRSTENGGSSTWAGGWAYLPYWLKLVRCGDRFTGYKSPDGVTWTMVGYADVSMGAAVEIGLAVTSHDKTLSATSNFDNIRVDRWSSCDIGAIGVPGSETFDPATGTYGVTGSGAGIGGTSDAFRFVYQALDGDGEIVARIRGISRINDSSKAGLMIRETLSAGSRSALISYAPGSGFLLTSRSTENGGSSTWAGGWAPDPVWLKLQRHGNLFVGYKSADGIAWTYVGQYSIPMTQTVYVGMAASSCSKWLLGSATFDSMKVDTLSNDNVGAASGGGKTFDPATGAYTVKGGGSAGIGGTTDAFYFVHRTLAGDGEIVARVGDVSQINASSKAGLMIRETLSAGSRSALISYAPGYGFAFTSRLNVSGSSSTWGGGWMPGPYWLKLIRWGNRFTGYKSPDGITWTMVGYADIPMASTTEIGLAVSSSDAAKIATATFENVSITLTPYHKTNIFW
ncbi:MAG: glycosyl hydrolase [Victivallales bacterium]